MLEGELGTKCMVELLDQIVRELGFHRCREIMVFLQNSMHRLAALWSPLGPSAIQLTLCGSEV